MKKLLQYLGYIFGIFLIMCGIGSVAVSFIAPFFFFLGASLFFETSRDYAFKLTKRSLSGSEKRGLLFVSLFGGIMIMGLTLDADKKEKQAVESARVAQERESIQQEKQEIESARVVKEKEYVQQAKKERETFESNSPWAILGVAVGDSIHNPNVTKICKPRVLHDPQELGHESSYHCLADYNKDYVVIHATPVDDTVTFISRTIKFRSKDNVDTVAVFNKAVDSYGKPDYKGESLALYGQGFKRNKYDKIRSSVNYNEKISGKGLAIYERLCGKDCQWVRLYNLGSNGYGKLVILEAIDGDAELKAKVELKKLKVLHLNSNTQKELDKVKF